jgi:cytochrome b
LLKNLVMLALIVALIWGLMQAAKLNMPALQPNKTRILDY